MNYTTLRKPNRKTASVAVAPNNTVTITVPESLTDVEVANIISNKRQWILKKQAFNNEVSYPFKVKEYVNGEAFSYLGRNYRLKISDDCESVELKNGFFIAPSTGTRESLVTWFQSHARQKLKARSKSVCKHLGIDVPKVEIRGYKRQWGSCHQDGTIYYNWKIIMAPTSVVDYVVAHELCHLKYHDHSKEFWRLLSTVMPDYLERKDWLRINGSLLEI